LSAHPLEQYLTNLAAIRNTGAGTAETSYYPPLVALLDAIGNTLRPKVRAVNQLANTGAGLPDGGLFAASQFKKRGDAEPLPGQMPERGVIEIKSPKEEVSAIADTKQVSKYWAKYKLVLVTNYRDFRLVGERDGKPVTVESYRLADSEAAFWALAAHPQKAATEQGDRFADFIARCLRRNAPLSDPKDVAWFLASYARDARTRVEQAELPALESIRGSLEESLGLKFEGPKGEHFFRSTLVQTLFYGVFAGWVLWHREGAKGNFDWKLAAWHLHVPMIRALYEQLAQASSVRRLGLEESLNLAADVLNRIDRSEFFKQFEDRHAVQYFYEPFLEAFDPDLRKELGVWYTPEEIVRYMVARVDQVLQTELGLADGLGDPNVYVLDPACGTGAYLVEVLRVIAEKQKAKGEDALAAQELKRAMTERVFGFELLPAPFVISHLQIGLLLSDAGAPLAEDERAGVYLTNALTGWEPLTAPKKAAFPGFEEERELSGKIKQQTPILVMLGNPPYNSYSGVAAGEEKELVEPYKKDLTSKWGIRKYNLDELSIRFFRLAERQIAERNGLGVVCFISPFSYLNDPSLVVMRSNLLEKFDGIWIDCLNGDSRETGKRTPEGGPDLSVFSTPQNREGIQKGTAISLLVKKPQSTPAAQAGVHFQEFWGTTKREDLIGSLDDVEFDQRYKKLSPTTQNRLSMRPQQAANQYFDWPTVVELAGHDPVYGLNENRRGAMIDIDRSEVNNRITAYLDKNATDAVAATVCEGLMRKAARFDPVKCRYKALHEHKFDQNNFRRYSTAPFDIRWCYWSANRPMWNEPRPDLVAQHWSGNSFLYVRRFGRKTDERFPVFSGSALPDLHLMDPDILAIPFRWRTDVMGSHSFGANLSPKARAYLHSLGLPDADVNPEVAALIWYHALAIAYSAAWLSENGDAIRGGFPRVPLPADAAQFEASAELGKLLAALMDADSPVKGVTSGTISVELRGIAVISRVGGGSLNPAKGDLALTANWGRQGQDGKTMPGLGKVVQRSTSDAAPLPDEVAGKVSAAGEQVAAHQVVDVYLNGLAYWKGIPAPVWGFTVGGYQVMKKWLSYRERSVLGRDLTTDEARSFTEMARRIAAILAIGSQLDDNYQAVKATSYAWNTR